MIAPWWQSSRAKGWLGGCFVVRIFGRDVIVHVRGACSCRPSYQT